MIFPIIICMHQYKPFLTVQSLQKRKQRFLFLRAERFNQHETPGSLLAEFGAAGNTLREAIRAGRCFGTCVAELLEGLGCG